MFSPKSVLKHPLIPLSPETNSILGLKRTKVGDAKEVACFSGLSIESAESQNTADFTVPGCPESVCMHSPVEAFQTLAVPSSEAVSTSYPPAENTAVCTSLECPESVAGNGVYNITSFAYNFFLFFLSVRRIGFCQLVFFVERFVDRSVKKNN